jgi:hypothetical protein
MVPVALHFPAAGTGEGVAGRREGVAVRAAEVMAGGATLALEMAEGEDPAQPAKRMPTTARIVERRSMDSPVSNVVDWSLRRIGQRLFPAVRLRDHHARPPRAP